MLLSAGLVISLQSNPMSRTAQPSTTSPLLMVTHQMGFAKEFADRVCFFDLGKIAEQGPTDQLFGNPSNERTRQFLSAVLEAG